MSPGAAVPASTVFEERRILVEPGRVEDYLDACRSALWPAVRAAGGEVVCVLGGLVGNPSNELVEMTSWPSAGAWRSAHEVERARPAGLHTGEEARLLTAIASRPKAVIPPGDRRAVYGYRRFFIDPGDLEEFVHCSENGIWPRIESMGTCILGLWTTAAATRPREILLITGYHGPAHWEETRYAGPPPAGVDRALWDHEKALRRRRVEMTLKSWVCLMNGHAI